MCSTPSEWTTIPQQEESFTVWLISSSCSCPRETMMKDLDMSNTRKNGRREPPQSTVTRAVTTIEPPRQVNPIKNMEAQYRWSPTNPVKNAINLIKNENELTLFKCQENVKKDCWREKIEEEQNQVVTVNLVYNSSPSWHEFLHDKFHSSIPYPWEQVPVSNHGHIYREKQENSTHQVIQTHLPFEFLESERQTDDSLTIFPLSIFERNMIGINSTLTYWLCITHHIMCSLSSFRYGRFLL